LILIFECVYVCVHIVTCKTDHHTAILQMQQESKVYNIYRYMKLSSTHCVAFIYIYIIRIYIYIYTCTYISTYIFAYRERESAVCERERDICIHIFIYANMVCP